MPKTKKNKAAEAQAVQETVEAQAPEAGKNGAREIAYINNIPKTYMQAQEGKGARVGVTMPMDDAKLQEALQRQAAQLEQAKANPEAGIKVDLVRQPVATVYVNNREQQVIQSKFNENAINVRGYELPVKMPGEDRKVLDADGIKGLNEDHKAAISQHKEFLAEPNAAAREYNTENAKNIEAAAKAKEAIAKAQEAAGKTAPAAEAEKGAELEG